MTPEQSRVIEAAKALIEAESSRRYQATWSELVKSLDALARSEQQEASEILPCPFCGGGGMVTEVDGAWFPTCVDCSCDLGNHPTKSDAIAAWNRRAK